MQPIDIAIFDAISAALQERVDDTNTRTAVVYGAVLAAAMPDGRLLAESLNDGAERDAARAEVDRLSALLTKHGGHERGCPLWVEPECLTDPCMCGWAAIVAEQETP